MKCEITLKELNSLNRSIDQGELRCMDCNSTHIGFKSESKSACTFDISTPDIRQEIIGSITEKIASYNEDIERITSDINICQAQLQQLLDNDDITLETIVAYKKDILDASIAESRILDIDKELKTLTAQLTVDGNNADYLADKQYALINRTIESMNSTYHEIDPSGNLEFDGLFTKKDKVYSGSEAIIFHLVKLFSLAKITNHSYPIIVDSFRAEDLSTSKEDIVIKLFSTLGIQIIFTTTLKEEETGKYDNMKAINHINFSDHESSKMLKKDYVNEFMFLIKQFGLAVY